MLLKLKSSSSWQLSRLFARVCFPAQSTPLCTVFSVLGGQTIGSHHWLLKLKWQCNNLVSICRCHCQYFFSLKNRGKGDTSTVILLFVYIPNLSPLPKSAIHLSTFFITNTQRCALSLTNTAIYWSVTLKALVLPPCQLLVFI